MINALISTSQDASDPTFQRLLIPVTRTLGECLIAARNARASIVSLGDVMQRLFVTVMTMTEAIHRTAEYAVDMVEQIRDETAERD